MRTMLLRSLTVAALLLLGAAGASAAPAVAATEQPGPPADLGLATITLTAPNFTGAATRPTFVWEPVAGAAAYSVFVLTGAGDPIWAWQGPATSVVLGGWPATPPADAPGPLLLGPGRWFAVALDATDSPIATSELRPVAP
jgi:hypothetical protein